MVVVLSCPPIAYRYPSIASRHTPQRGLLKGATSALQLSVSGLYLPWWKSRTRNVKVLGKTISAAGNNNLSRTHTDLSFHSNLYFSSVLYVYSCVLLRKRNCLTCMDIQWNICQCFFVTEKLLKWLSLHFSLLDGNLHPTEQHFLLIGKFLCLSGAQAIQPKCPNPSEIMSIQ